jgi:hypothetical protein
MRDAIEAVAALLDRARVPYVLIGAHAVNVWIEPRFTADIDVTVQASRDDLARLAASLASNGLATSREHGAELPSGPDFIRFSSVDGDVVVEVQVAKTDFQREVIRRAVDERGLRVATPEDLIVMKLIADRPKDRIDLRGLVALPELDWAYVERWAAEWGVAERIDELRSAEKR